CAREYLQRVLAGELWRFRAPIAGETAGGPSQPPAGSLAELEATLLAEAIQAHKANKHGVLALVHALDERATALEVLARLSSRLKTSRIPARIYLPGSELNLTVPGPILAPSFEALNWLVALAPRSRLWVALLARHSQNRWLDNSPVPVLQVRSLPRSDALGLARQSFYEATSSVAVGLQDTEARLLDAICVPGAVGKAIRASQLAAMLNCEPAGLESGLAALVDQELINPRLDEVAAEYEPDVSYQVVDRKFAAARLESRGEEDRLTLYRNWWRSLRRDASDDRFAFYEFVAWLAEGRQRPLARRFLREVLPASDKNTPQAGQEVKEALGLQESRELRAWGELLEELRFPVAVALLELALRQEPNNPYLLHTLGRCYGRRARNLAGPGIGRQYEYRRAVDCFHGAATHEATCVVAQHSLIDLELELGRVREADRVFGANRDLSSPWWATLNGKIAARLRRPGVLQRLQEAQERDPDNFFFGVMLADFHAQRHKYRDAIGLLNNVLMKHPDHLQALTLKARIYRDRGWLNSALQTLEHVLQEYPENEYALHLAADIHAERRQWTEASAYYRRLEEADPGNLPGRISRCDWLLKHSPGPHPEVERLLPPPGDPLADHPHVVSIRARLHLAAGRHEEGLEVLQELYTQYPDSSVLRNQLALALARLKRFDEARALVEGASRGVIDENTYARVLRREAAHWAEQRQTDRAAQSLQEAYQCYRRSREIDDENLYTLRGLLGLFNEWEKIQPDVSSAHDGELSQARAALPAGGLPIEEPEDLWRES
ncbi:MAG: tetratricopeptide repeat protein, partial [Bryobacteraceae bacterium]